MKRRIGDLLGEAFDSLRRHIPRFDKGSPAHNENVLGVLSALQRPSLPEQLAKVEIECPEPSGSEDEWTVVLDEVDKIEAAADFLARNERYDLAGGAFRHSKRDQGRLD